MCCCEQVPEQVYNMNQTDKLRRTELHVLSHRVNSPNNCLCAISDVNAVSGELSAGVLHNVTMQAQPTAESVHGLWWASKARFSVLSDWPKAHNGCRGKLYCPDQKETHNFVAPKLHGQTHKAKCDTTCF